MRKKKTCNPQDFGAGSVVCVCNITYCDEFEPVNVKPAFATIIESSKDGKRFFRRQISIRTQKENNATNYETDSYFEIVINRAKKYQRILGFGGTFVDSAPINIMSWPPSMARRIIRDYYSDHGLQFTVERIPIGGCDYSTRLYTVWSASAWIKTSNSLIGGTLKGKPGGKYYEIWANYLIKQFFTDESSVMIIDDNIDVLLPFTKAILEDSSARNFVSGIACQSYKNNVYP
ncbi:glucosylceramidase-like protein [Dinothrombium tinctorium]|uniref:Glucosylceramidase n=1 Tax=Dinothrombium tinctorium TaxID=1965070 RepID=A0A3S3SQA4_9ACAR|nr:glucosylceramidase-like protein [Dinothrombium tinctorium]